MKEKRVVGVMTSGAGEKEKERVCEVSRNTKNFEG